ncbi:MAG: tripartite tricarboxylate transporter substrate binding protein [Rhizobiales bacterium]|nr:tripartite tricarboxylate transporter substrate binding protein [Hyphomicrobiales bacterium]
MTHRISRRAFTVAGLAGAAGLAMPNIVRAQGDYPNKPIRIIVPFGAAGSSDISARLLQAPFHQALGQPFIIENRPGAGSNIGTAAVARAEPDGYTLMITSSGFVVNPTLYAKPPYDAYKQFAPICDIADAANVLVVNPDSKFKTLKDAVDFAKANPGKLNVASAGIGTTPHLAIELMKQRAGIDIVPIPYNGGGPAAQAMLGGQTDLFFSAMPNIYSHLTGGTMRALAISAHERWPELPDVPTFIESGFPDFITATGHLFLAPAATPPAIVKKLSDLSVEIIKRKDIADAFRKLGYAPVGGGSEAAKARIAKDIPFYGDIITKANLRIE